jgi:hypothetical protein
MGSKQAYKYTLYTQIEASNTKTKTLSGVNLSGFLRQPTGKQQAQRRPRGLISG